MSLRSPPRPHGRRKKPRFVSSVPLLPFKGPQAPKCAPILTRGGPQPPDNRRGGTGLGASGKGSWSNVVHGGFLCFYFVVNIKKCVNCLIPPTMESTLVLLPAGWPRRPGARERVRPHCGCTDRQKQAMLSAGGGEAGRPRTVGRPERPGRAVGSGGRSEEFGGFFYLYFLLFSFFCLFLSFMIFFVVVVFCYTVRS